MPGGRVCPRDGQHAINQTTARTAKAIRQTDRSSRTLDIATCYRCQKKNKNKNFSLSLSPQISFEKSASRYCQDLLFLFLF